MTTDELRALERAKDAVIEAARRHKAARNFFSACDCGVCKALDALDSAAAPSATAGAGGNIRWATSKEIASEMCFTKEDEARIRELARVEAYDRIKSHETDPGQGHRRAFDAYDGVTELNRRVSALEASRLSSPVRAPEVRRIIIENRTEKAVSVDPFADPPAEPDGGEAEDAWKLWKAAPSNTTLDPQWMSHYGFQCACRQLSAAAEKRGREGILKELLDWADYHFGGERESPLHRKLAAIRSAIASEVKT